MESESEDDRQALLDRISRWDGPESGPLHDLAGMTREQFRAWLTRSPEGERVEVGRKMATRARLDAEFIAESVRLKSKGFTHARIAEIMCASHTLVSRALKAARLGDPHGGEMP